MKPINEFQRMNNGTSTARERGNIEMPGADAKSIRADTLRYFHFTLGRDEFQRSKSYLFQAFALAVRDRLAAAANTTRHAFAAADARRTPTCHWNSCRGVRSAMPCSILASKVRRENR